LRNFNGKKDLQAALEEVSKLYQQKERKIQLDVSAIKRSLNSRPRHG